MNKRRVREFDTHRMNTTNDFGKKWRVFISWNKPNNAFRDNWKKPSKRPKRLRRAWRKNRHGVNRLKRINNGIISSWKRISKTPKCNWNCVNSKLPKWKNTTSSNNNRMQLTTNPREEILLLPQKCTSCAKPLNAKSKRPKPSNSEHKKIWLWRKNDSSSKSPKLLNSPKNSRICKVKIHPYPTNWNYSASNWIIWKPWKPVTRTNWNSMAQPWMRRTKQNKHWSVKWPTWINEFKNRKDISNRPSKRLPNNAWNLKRSRKNKNDKLQCNPSR